MKLVIDCFKLIKGKGKSIGIYNVAYSLVRQLSKDHELTVFGTEMNREDFDLPGVNFVCINKNPLSRLTCVLWELVFVTGELKKTGVDRVLFPRGFAALKCFSGKIKQYVIIHDMIPFYYDKNYPDVLNRLENFYIMTRLKASARAAYRVLTLSEVSKQEIVSIAGIKPEKITVTYLGQNPVTEPKEKYEGKPYISAMCSLLPHKNAVGIVKSYEKYCERAGENALDLKIIGLKDVEDYGLSEEIKAKISCYKYLEKNEDMHGLIANSTFFLFLSKIEGFGFPPLEAMQLGVPVVSSGAYSLSEVVGDAAIVVEPDNYEEAAEAMVKMNDSETRAYYIEKGNENVRRFLWKDIIKNFEKVIFEE